MTRRPYRFAYISPDGLYRYTLIFLWGHGNKIVNWCCLNPSKADANTNDPSFVRMQKFSESWGYDGMIITNLFAYRATDPMVMRQAADPVGPENDGVIETISTICDLTVCGWGVNGSLLNRDRAALRLIRRPHYLRLTKHGMPQHPLYLESELQPRPWLNCDPTDPI